MQNAKTTKYLYKNAKEKHSFMQYFLHKQVFLVDNQGAFASLKENQRFSEAVYKLAKCLVNKGFCRSMCQIVCQKF